VGLLVGRTLTLQLLTAGVTVVLARILTPSDYGLFSLALAVQLVGQRAAELGLPAALVRMEEKPSPHLQAAVAGVLLLSSTTLAALLLLVGFVIAPALGGGSTAQVIAIAGCAIPLYAARAVPLVLMERELRFGRVAIVETADTLAFNGFALAGALAGLGAFSLVGAVPAGALTGAITAWAIQPFARRPTLDLAPVRPLASFGLRVSLLQGVALTKELGFVTLIAAIGGTATAGFYGMAKRLFSFPIALTSAVGRVALPALSRDRERSAARAAQIIALTALVAGLPLALVAGAAQPLITVLLGSEWLPTTDIVLLGSLGLMITASALTTMMSYALAQGQPNAPIVATAAEAIVQFAIAIALTATMGETAVGLAVALGSATSLLVFCISTDPRLRRSVLRVGRTTLIAAASTGAAQALNVSNDLGGLIVALATVTVTWVGLEALFARAELTELLRLARPVLRRMQRA
jgi:PST family polysaccharide transporter